MWPEIRIHLWQVPRCGPQPSMTNLSRNDYQNIHNWVRTRLLKPKFCQICNVVYPRDLANISGEYKRDLSDWQWLCRNCHMTSDGRKYTMPHGPKKRFDMSGRKCSMCGNKTYVMSNSREHWAYIEGQLVCNRCYHKQWYESKKCQNRLVKNVG